MVILDAAMKRRNYNTCYISVSGSHLAWLVIPDFTNKITIKIDLVQSFITFWVIAKKFDKTPDLESVYMRFHFG